MKFVKIQSLETIQSSSVNDVFECYVLVVYGTYFNYRPAVTKYIHADVIDKDGEKTITVTCKGSLCTPLMRVIRKNAYLQISGFQILQKDGRYQKGDCAIYLQLSNSSKVSEIPAWIPLAKPLFYIAESICDIRTEPSVEWASTTIAIVLLSSSDEKIFIIADGSRPEDQATLQFSWHNQEDAEQLVRAFRIQEEPIFRIFKNVTILNTGTECSFRVDRHTIFCEVHADNLRENLSQVHGVQQSLPRNQLANITVTGRLKVANAARSIYIQTCAVCKGTNLDHVTEDMSENRRFCRTCRATQQIIPVIEIDCVIYPEEGVEIMVKADARCLKQLCQKTKEEILELKGVKLQIFLHSIRLNANFHINDGYLVQIILPVDLHKIKNDSSTTGLTITVPSTPAKNKSMLGQNEKGRKRSKK